MGGPPQCPGPRLGGGSVGYVAPENNISSALQMDLSEQGLARRVVPSDLLPLSLTGRRRQGHPPSCREILERYLSGNNSIAAPPSVSCAVNPAEMMMMRPPTTPTLRPCAYAYHKMTGAWCRDGDPYCQSQGKRQPSTILASGLPTTSVAPPPQVPDMPDMLPPATRHAVVVELFNYRTALSALLSTMAQPLPLCARYRVGLLSRTHTHTHTHTHHTTRTRTQYVCLGTARVSWIADDWPISGGPVDSCSRENPPTAVSVFPLPIHETVGSCRYANLSPGKGEKGEKGPGLLNSMCRVVRCDGLATPEDSGGVWLQTEQGH